MNGLSKTPTVKKNAVAPNCQSQFAHHLWPTLSNETDEDVKNVFTTRFALSKKLQLLRGAILIVIKCSRQRDFRLEKVIAQSCVKLSAQKVSDLARNPRRTHRRRQQRMRPHSGNPVLRKRKRRRNRPWTHARQLRRLPYPRHKIRRRL